MSERGGRDREGDATPLRIVPARWDVAAEREAMTAIRHEVFVLEQNVPVELELDGHDPHCRHWLVFDAANRPIATARMRGDGHVGRIAVVTEWRKRGVGARLVEAIVSDARGAGLDAVDLDAQVHAIGFYERLGFEAHGEVFLDAGIPHRRMRRRLA